MTAARMQNWLKFSGTNEVCVSEKSRGKFVNSPNIQVIIFTPDMLFGV